MSVLKYKIELEDGRVFSGECEAQGEKHIIESLPEGKLKAVTAEMELSIADGEKIFMNGYQTWTYCPEYDSKGFTPDVLHAPRFIIDYFGADRYGDYHFVDYPETPGITHGESYCYFRKGEIFRLIGSLDERPGYTLFRYDSRSGVLSIERDCKGVNCGGEFHAFDLFFAEGSESEVFDGWFAAMNIKPCKAKPMAGYSSWYNRYQNIDGKSIYEDLKGCATVLKKGDLFQIDDGWETAVGDWLECDKKKFPGGMKKAVEDIHEKGFLAGLWLAPFVCQKSSKIMEEHPDWLLKRNGNNWYCGCNWGGFYSLDIDNKEVVDYIERSFRQVFDEWGFDLVKLDFLYGAAPFGTDNASRAGRMIRAMELLRRVCGDKLILGCGVPLMPAFGLVDYCRISCDVGLDWRNKPFFRRGNREVVSTEHAIGNSVFRRELNGRAFLNDPDVFFLREDNIKLNAVQKHILATVNSLFGGILLCSDNMGKYSSQAREQYQQLLKNRDAESIEVCADNGLRIKYRVDGEEKELVIK